MQTFDSQSRTQNTSTTKVSTSQTYLPHNSPQQSSQSDKQLTWLIRYNHLTYLLYFLNIFMVGIFFIIPVVMNYLKRPEAHGTWLATHFDWQIKTFWYGLFFVTMGILMMIFSIAGLGVSIFAESSPLAFGSVGLFNLGLLMIGFTMLWYLYRLIRGWIALADKRPVP